MSTETQRDDHQTGGEINEDGPGINGDLASWLYVLGGIPSMIIFFVVLFALVGSCDNQNMMING
jgi:hypothetical protein